MLKPPPPNEASPPVEGRGFPFGKGSAFGGKAAILASFIPELSSGYSEARNKALYKPFLLQSNKLCLLPVIIFLLIILSGLFFLKPKIAQVLNIRRNFSSQKAELAKLTAKVAALQGLDEVELEEKTKVALRALPAQKDLPGALLTIKSLTTETGLELREIQVEPGEISTESAELQSSKKYNLSFLEFKINVGGSKTQLKDFLTKLSLTAPLMRVAGIKIAQTEGEVVEADLDLDTFLLFLPSTLGAVEQQLAPITPQEEGIYQQLAKIAPVQQEAFSPVTSGKENPFTP